MSYSQLSLDFLIQDVLPPKDGDCLQVDCLYSGFSGIGIFRELSPIIGWYGIEIKHRKTLIIKYFDGLHCRPATLNV